MLPLAIADPRTPLARTGRLPVTVLSGFPRAGMTTLLRRILDNREVSRVAVVVNDLGEVNVGARIVRQEIAFTRVKITRPHLERLRDPALSSDDEQSWHPGRWASLPDPLPPW